MVHAIARALLNRVGFLLFTGVCLMLTPWRWAHLAGFVLLFTVFDVYGFRYVGKFKTGKENGVLEYRIMQIMFQAVFIALISLIDGKATAVACFIAWWLLVSDVLYYWALNETLTPFTWALWSPVNAVYHFIFHQPTPVSAVITSALTGTATGLFLTLADR